VQFHTVMMLSTISDVAMIFDLGRGA